MKAGRIILCLFIIGLFYGCSGGGNQQAANQEQTKKRLLKVLANDQLVSHKTGDPSTSLANDQTEPAVAYDTVNNQYLVVWTDYSNVNTSCPDLAAVPPLPAVLSGDCGTDIYGAICKGTGTGTNTTMSCGDSFPIIKAVGNQSQPKVAYVNDPVTPANSKYFVVWTDTRNGSNSSIVGQFISPASTQTATLSGPNIPISHFDAGKNINQFNPDIIFNPVKNKFIVSWVDTSISDLDDNVFISRNSPPAVSWTAGDNFTLTDPAGLRNVDLMLVDNSTIPSTVTLLSRDFDYSVTRVDSQTVTITIINDPLGGSNTVIGQPLDIITAYGNVLRLQGGGCTNSILLNYIPLPLVDNNLIRTVEISSTGVVDPSSLKNTSQLVRIPPSSDSGSVITVTWSVQLNETAPKTSFNSATGDYFSAWSGMDHTVTLTVNYQGSPGFCTYKAPLFATTSDNDAGKPKIKVRKDSGLGLLQEFSFGTFAVSPTLATDPNTNRLLVAWEEQSGTDKDILGQLIDVTNFVNFGSGIKISNSFTNGIVGLAPGDQSSPVAAFDNVNQRFLVTWEDARNQSANISNVDIYGQFVDPQGNLSGGNIPVTVAAGNQLAPAVAFGNVNFRDFFVVWKDGRDPSNSDIFGQLMEFSTAPQLLITDSTGNPILNGAINFGNINVGAFSDIGFKLCNEGNTQLTINSMSSPDAPFSFTTPIPQTISPSSNPAVPGSCYDMTVHFEPNAAGSFAGNPSNNFKTTIDSNGGKVTIFFSGNGVGVQPLVVKTSSLADGSLNTAYSATLIGFGGVFPYKWDIKTGALPTGISLDQATGVLSGTPTVAGIYNFTVRVTDNAGKTAVADLSIKVSVLSITKAGLKPWTQGVEYSSGTKEFMTATGGSGTFTWAVVDQTINTLGCTGGAYPISNTGLCLSNSTGLISGVPISSGAFTFNVLVTDTTSPTAQTATKSFTITINPPPAILTTSLPPGVSGTAYNQTIFMSGGTSPNTWSISAGSLPTGLTIDPVTGIISGTPTASGTSNFTVTVTDATGKSDSKAYTLKINSLLNITNPTSGPGVPPGPPSPPIATVGTPYPYTFIADGGTAPYSWSVVAGSLPLGLAVNTFTGVVSGSPTTTGTFVFTLQVKDVNGTAVVKTFSITVSDLSITKLTLKAGTIGAPYSDIVTATGGTLPYAWSVSSGSLPPGLTLSTGSGAVSGSPTGTGTFNFTLKVTDSVGATASQAYTIVISPAVFITTSNLPSGTKGVLYSQQLAIAGGTAPFSWILANGTTLPDGLALDAFTGTISGIPTGLASGPISFDVKVTDASGATFTRTLSITIISSFSVTTIPAPGNGTVGLAYNFTFTASGGTAPFTWSETGSFPTGLALDALTGTISGSPTVAGTFNFTVQATDADGRTAKQNFTIVVAGTVSITKLTLKAGTMGAPYSDTATATGGTLPYVWSVSAGILPPGLTLNASTGALSGTPTGTGTFNFTLKVTDANSASAIQVYTIVISPALFITTAGLPTGANGILYSQQLAIVGGTAPFSWTLANGTTLPAGLTLDSFAGVISGIPTGGSGDTVFDVTVTDASNASYTKTHLKITIISPFSVTAIPAPGNGTVGLLYSYTFAASGGRAPYTWSETGSFPTGLILNALTGAISGTPTVAGTFNFSVQATDADGRTATQDFTIVISGTVNITKLTLKNGTINTSYNDTATATGGTLPYVWSVSAGILPPGLTLNASTGALSGTPTGTGTFNFTLKVTDANSASAIQAYTIVISPAIFITTASLPAGSSGILYSQQLTITGGTAPFSWTITAGALPAGLMLDSFTGVINGIPTGGDATSTFTVTVADASGANNAKSFSIAIISSSGTISITTASLPDTFVNKSGYSQTFGATGGSVPLTWSLKDGTLPPGLSLNGVTGILSGTPTAIGSYSFHIQVTDIDGRTATQLFTIVVADAGSAIVESDNGTVPQDQVVIIPASQLPIPLPTDFNATKAVSFEVDGVTNASANITLTFSSLPATPVFFKLKANNQYQQLQNCSGAGDTNCIVSLDTVNKQLIVRIADNGIFDADPTTGTIKDPIVAGFISSGNGTGGGGGGTLSGGGGGGCSIGGRQNAPTAFADTAVMLTPLFVIMILRGLRRRKK